MTGKLEPWQERALARVHRRLLRHLPPACSGSVSREKFARAYVYGLKGSGVPGGAPWGSGPYLHHYIKTCGISPEKWAQLSEDTSAVVHRIHRGIRAPEGWLFTRWSYSLWFWWRFRRG